MLIILRLHIWCNHAADHATVILETLSRCLLLLARLVDVRVCHKMLPHWRLIRRPLNDDVVAVMSELRVCIRAICEAKGAQQHFLHLWRQQGLGGAKPVLLGQAPRKEWVFATICHPLKARRYLLLLGQLHTQVTDPR